MTGILIMVALLAQLDAPAAAGKVRKELKPGTIVATNKDAVCLALKDAEEIKAAGGAPGLVRYVFIPPWIDPRSGFQQVAHVVNSTITRTATRPQPRLLQDKAKGTTVVAIDLDKYASRAEQIAEIIGLYERLAPRDSWFNTEVVVIGHEVIEVTAEFLAGQAVEIQLTNGTWAPATFKGKAGSRFSCEWNGKVVVCSTVRPLKKTAHNFNGDAFVKRTFTAEPYLEAEGIRLFELTCSNVPIMRLDEFVVFSTDSVNGGLYYEFIGVERNLGNFVARFAGLDAAKKVLRQTELMRLAEEQHRREKDTYGKQARGILEIAGEFDQELAKSKAVMNESNVTRRPRAFLFLAGANIAPAEGVQLVSITFDVAEDNTNPDADPQRSLTKYETYNGGEAIVAMPNGMLAYFVFDAQDKSLEDVPAKVAWNNKAPVYRTNVGTVRVTTAVCAACHDFDEKNWGYQPVQNDIARDFERMAKILGDRPHLGTHADKFKEIQRLAANYAAGDAEIADMLTRSRLSYQRAVTLATGAKSSREVILGTADSYFGYWNDYVWPETIVRDMGHVMTRKESQAWLIQNIEPEPDNLIPDLFREDRIIARAKDGESIHPTLQYLPIAPEFAERRLFSKAKPKQPNPLLEGLKP